MKNLMKNINEHTQFVGTLVFIRAMFRDYLNENAPVTDPLSKIVDSLMSGVRLSEEDAMKLIREVRDPLDQFDQFEIELREDIIDKTVGQY